MSCAEGRSCCLKQFQYLKLRDGYHWKTLLFVQSKMDLIEDKNNPDNVRLISSSSTNSTNSQPKVQQKMSRLHMAQGGSIGCLHRRLISLRQPARHNQKLF